MSIQPKITTLINFNREQIKELAQERNVMKKVLFLDVEYANCKNKSICQIGLLSEYFSDRDPVFPEKNIYINPEDNFQDSCIKIHNITPQKIKNSPNFPKVWTEIEKYFTNAIIIGHNVLSSDLYAIAYSCQRYDIKLPQLLYIDTMKMAKDYILPCDINSYSLQNLCEYFDIYTDNAHDAFDDACATSDLFFSLIKAFNINIEDYINNFSLKEAKEFNAYITDNSLKNIINEFYGMIEGFVFDKKIKQEEIEYVKQWSINNSHLRTKKELENIFFTIDKILKDGIITLDEMSELKSVIRKYYETISGALITKSLQELIGILKGIIIDNEVVTIEGRELLNWMHKNIYLVNHYPYNEILPIFEQCLKDNIITKEESENIIKIINKVLQPIKTLQNQLLSFKNKHICLTGNFSFGQKSDVEKIILEKGGYIDKIVKKTTDILIVGNYESQSYALGSYGKKIKTAMEYIKKGNSIIIVKEKDVGELCTQHIEKKVTL